MRKCDRLHPGSQFPEGLKSFESLSDTIKGVLDEEDDHLYNQPDMSDKIQDERCLKDGRNMINRVNVTEQIIEYIRQRIENGDWKVGEKIPSENTLTRELGVSRASVRDAIKYFAGQGLMQTYHGKGTYLVDLSAGEKDEVITIVTSADCRNIKEVLEFRRALESEACELAAMNMDDEALALLQYCQDEMARNKHNKEAYLKADMEFHRLIAEYSGNVLIKKILYQIMVESWDSIYQMYDLFGYRNGLSQHLLVLNALKEKNPKAARAAMHDHMQRAIDKLMAKEIVESDAQAG